MQNRGISMMSSPVGPMESAEVLRERKAHAAALARIKNRKPEIGNVGPKRKERQQGKRKQMIKARNNEIEASNKRLVAKMALIITKNSNITGDYQKREAITRAQSLRRREEEEEKQKVVSKKMKQRLAEIKPIYNHEEWNKKRSEQEVILKRLNKWGSGGVALDKKKIPKHNSKKEVLPRHEKLITKKEALPQYTANKVRRPVTRRRHPAQAITLDKEEKDKTSRSSKELDCVEAQAERNMLPLEEDTSIQDKVDSQIDPAEEDNNILDFTINEQKVTAARDSIRRRSSVDGDFVYVKGRPFTPGRFPIQPPSETMIVSKDDMNLNTLEHTATCYLTLGNRKHALIITATTHAKDDRGNIDLRLVAAKRLTTAEMSLASSQNTSDTKKAHKDIASTTLYTKMPTIAIVDLQVATTYISTFTEKIAYHTATSLHACAQDALNRQRIDNILKFPDTIDSFLLDSVIDALALNRSSASINAKQASAVYSPE